MNPDTQYLETEKATSKKQPLRAAIKQLRRVDEAAGWHFTGKPFEVEASDGLRLSGERTPGPVANADAPTIVLSHCWTGDRTTWEPVSARLADAGYDVVVYDQRGHGTSELGATPPTIAQLTDDIRSVIDQLGLTRVVVAGHSLGGLVAQSLAIDGDPRLEGIGLFSTSARPSMVPLRFASNRRVMAAAEWVTGMYMTRVVQWAIQGFGGPFWVRPVMGPFSKRTAKETTLRTLRNTDPVAVSGQMREIVNVDLGPRLGEITVPAVIVVGSLDTLLPVPHAASLHRRIPRSELRVLRLVGHMTPAEQPIAAVEAIESVFGSMTKLPAGHLADLETR